MIPKLSAGMLDRRIAIENLTETQDTSGGQVNTWAPLATVWAQVEYLTGNERMLAAQLIPTGSVKFRIRWRADVTEKARIVYEGKVYDIQPPVAEIGRRDGLEIIGKLSA